MEFHPDNQGGARGARVPLPLRSLAHGACRITPLGLLGRSYYRIAARSIARDLARLDGILWIEQFGGSVDRCVPAVSDLDLLVMMSEAPKTLQQRIPMLSRRYRRWARQYPFLGEIHLTTERAWNLMEEASPAALFWFSPRKRFFDDGWRVISPRLSASGESRFALAFHHYVRAKRLWIGPNRLHRALNDAAMRRELAKAIAILRQEPVRLDRKRPLPHLFAEVFCAMDGVLLGLVPRADSGDASVSAVDLATKRFVTDLINLYWQQKFRAEPELKELTTTTIPLAFCVERRRDADGMATLFDRLFRFLGRQEVTKQPPILMSPIMIDWTLKGWCWGPLMEHLSWIPIAREKDEPWLRRCASQSLSRVVERALLDLNTLFGKFLYAPSEEIAAALEELSLEMLILVSRRMTQDTRLLLEGSDAAPASARAVHLISQRRRSLSREKLLEMAIDVFQEGLPIVAQQLAMDWRGR